MNFIQIDGWAAAGKGALWSLLDGHKDIFVNPIHDFSHCALFNDITHNSFRKAFATTEYYKLEKLSKIGYDPIDFGGKKSINNIFNFDFYEFDKKIAEYLSDPYKIKDVGVILDVYMNAFIESYKNKKYHSNELKYFASMGNYYLWQSYTNSELMRCIHTIFVRRSPEGIIAARINREKRSIDSEGSNQFAPSFTQLMSIGDVEAICAYNDLISSMEKNFPSSVLVLDFEDLIINTEDTMRRVAKFLSIDFDPILCISTRDGQPISIGETSFVGKVNDDPDLILSFWQKKRIKLHCYLYNLHRLPVNLFSINSIGLWLYRYLKKTNIIRSL